MRIGRFLSRSGALWLIPLFLVGFLLIFAATENIKDGEKEENRRHLEESIRRAAVTCYALEGAYPPGVEYLTEHYGLQIDGESFGVFYEVFAENLMPEITVVNLK